jgi:hypothetical protein
VTTVLEKVRALIARALGTSFEEEARTSALVAVRLMKEHGLELVEGGRAPPPRASAPVPTEPSRERRPTPGTRAQRMHIRSRFDGWCRLCGEMFRAGDLIAWARGRGAVHARCDRDL